MTGFHKSQSPGLIPEEIGPPEKGVGSSLIFQINRLPIAELPSTQLGRPAM
jgi:hypothetical protein